MKKVLFATTALVATAGVAHADLELTGGAIFGLQQAATGDVHLHGEVDFNIVGSGSTDNGLTFGASLDIDGNFEGPTEDPDDFEAFISGDFGTITVGDIDQAGDSIGMDEIGFDGIGVDDDVEALRVGSADIAYSHSIGDFSFTITGAVGVASTDEPEEGDYGIYVSYTIDGFTIEAAYDHDESADAQSTGVELGYDAGAFDIGLVYIQGDTDSGYGIDLGYTIDALTLHAAYGDTDAAGDDADYGIGAAYDLGGGLSLSGGVGSVDGETVWDLGVIMSF